MTHRRPKSPGSFQDELGAVIDRVAPAGRELRPGSGKLIKPPARDTAELNERLFDSAWRKGD